MLLTQCFHLAFQPQKTPCFGTVARELCRWRRTHKHTYAYAHAHTAISLAHRSTWIIIIARSTSHRVNVWMNNILLGLQQIRTVKITTQQAPDFLLDHSYWAEKMTPFLTSHTLPQVIRFKIKNKSSGNLFQGREGGWSRNAYLPALPGKGC